MNGKVYSKPLGMFFRKYHCSHCGTRLENERTHRLITKNDRDYYQYHDAGEFPRRNYDVYSYRFKCPECKKRIAYKEQCITARIQKKLGRNVLSELEIKEYYDESKKKYTYQSHILNIALPILFSLLLFTILILCSDAPGRAFIVCLIAEVLVIASVIVNEIRRIKGNSRFRYKQDYSYEEKALFEKLHTYSINNMELISRSSRCVCFYCKKSMLPKDIIKYLEEENTALCPYCEIDAILPDSIDYTLDNETIDKMNQYWF